MPVSYIVETPDNGPADGLVFLIPGFGGDKDEALMALTRRHIAAKHNLVAVSVRAHCHYCRPNQSAEGITVGLEIDPKSLAQAVGSLVLQGDELAGLSSADQGAVVSFLKSRTGHAFEIGATLVPPGSDYQNFGVLTALDHLKVLHHLMGQDIAFARDNIVCLGTSHGGYVAHLMHKFAPAHISAVIESSAYTETMPAFLGFGGVEYVGQDGNLRFICKTRTAWSNEVVSADNYFGADEALIRDVTHPGHLETLVQATPGQPCQFRLVHSTKDRLFNISLKRRQASLLAQFGYDVVLDEMGESDVDGDFVTTLEHGLGVSLNKLFDRYYPTLTQRRGTADNLAMTCLVFEGPHKTYKIEHSGANSGREGSVTASIARNQPTTSQQVTLSA